MGTEAVNVDSCDKHNGEVDLSLSPRAPRSCPALRARLNNRPLCRVICCIFATKVTSGGKMNEWCDLFNIVTRILGATTRSRTYDRTITNIVSCFDRVLHRPHAKMAAFK